jgi:hypothetical protein
LGGLLAVLLVAAPPLAAVLPPPSADGTEADLTVTESRGAAAPARPSRIYAIQGKPELKGRLALALAHARGVPRKTDFWVAWVFDADPFPPDTVDEKAVLHLRYAADELSTPQRVEVRGNDKPRGEPGLPVYWLGRVSSGDSFALVTALLKDAKNDHDAGELTRAAGLHANAALLPLLRDTARRSPFPSARARAACALLRDPGQASYVAGLVLDDHEPIELRRAVAEALAASQNAEAHAVLSTIWAKAQDPDVRRLVKDAALASGRGTEVAAWPRSSRGEMLSTLKTSSSSPPRGPADRPR